MFMGRAGRLAASLSLVCFSAVFGAFVPARDQSVPSAGEDPVLKGILANKLAYSQKLQDYVYYFVCKEAVSETIRGKSKVRWSPPPLAGASNQIPGASTGQTMSVTDASTTHTYLYDYQLIRKKGNNQESRTLIEKNHERMAVPNAKLEAMRFYFENFAFGPIDLFGAVGRLRHEYRIVGREKVKGEPAIIVEAASTGETADYNPGGKVWIRESDDAILKIEWDQKTMVGFKDIQALADTVNAIPMFTLVTEYGIEKNGIRFPSHVLIREAYLRTKSRKIQIVSEVTIDYKDYKFFQVEVETK
jgi:hypothetical protein